MVLHCNELAVKLLTCFPDSFLDQIYFSYFDFCSQVSSLNMVCNTCKAFTSAWSVLYSDLLLLLFTSWKWDFDTRLAPLHITFLIMCTSCPYHLSSNKADWIWPWIIISIWALWNAFSLPFFIIKCSDKIHVNEEGKIHNCFSVILSFPIYIIDYDFLSCESLLYSCCLIWDIKVRFIVQFTMDL